MSREKFPVINRLAAAPTKAFEERRIALENENNEEQEENSLATMMIIIATKKMMDNNDDDLRIKNLPSQPLKNQQHLQSAPEISS